MLIKATGSRATHPVCTRTRMLVLAAGLCLLLPLTAGAKPTTPAPIAPAPVAPESPRAQLRAPTTAPTAAQTTERLAAISDRAAAYLLRTQDKVAGGWSIPGPAEQRPHLPAITALAATGLKMKSARTTADAPGKGDAPTAAALDASAARALDYILSHAKPDGGIYDAILPSYNTAISLSAIALFDTPEAKRAVAPAQEFLKRSQWGTITPVGVGGAKGREAPVLPGDAPAITPDHPFYGGLGYGNRGRPDLSNLAFAVQAWHDSGLSVEDEAYKRAVAFIQRIQMVPAEQNSLEPGTGNDQPYAAGISPEESVYGGFIYATAENQQTIGQGQSFAGRIVETLDDGTVVSRLRSYGSMTYAGFKSYLYAGLLPNDPRVKAAEKWMGRNWSLRENPGIGTDGYYYYLIMMGRAMTARGGETITVTNYAQSRASIIIRGVTPPALADNGKLARQAINAALATLAADEKAAATPAASTPAPTPAPAPVDTTLAAFIPLERRGDVLVYLRKEDIALKLATALQPLTKPGELFAEGDIAVAVTEQPRSTAPQEVNWRAALAEALWSLQQPDGSFAVLDDRWMENNPQLTTSYALVAIENALKPTAKPATK